jgi:hypothetical protein
VYIFINGEGCMAPRERAVDVIFGLPEWVVEDIRSGVKYCCSRVRAGAAGRFGPMGRVRCVAMRGARVVEADMHPCIDGTGRAFVINRDRGLDIERMRPLVCLGRGRRWKYEYDKLERRYGEMLEIARRARAVCRKYCVVDEYGYVVVFGDDIYEVVDGLAKLLSRQAMLAVLV